MTLFAAGLAVWFVDDVVTGTDIARGVEAGGIDIGRLDRAEAISTLGRIDDTIDATTVTLVLPDAEVEASATDLGFSVDREAMVDAARSTGFVLAQPIRWIDSLIGTETVDAVYAVDRDRLAETMTALGADPEFPRIELIGETFQASPTTAAPLPDIEALATLLETLLPTTLGQPARVIVPIGGLVAFDSEIAEQLADEANAVTANNAVVRLIGSSDQFRVSTIVLRSWVTLTGTTADPRLVFDDELALPTLRSLFTGIGVDGEPAVFGVDDDWNVEIAGGEPGFECCAADAAEVLLAGIRDGLGVIDLPGEEIPHPEGRQWAESRGISDLVGEFTTEFVAGQSRVTNIARISELTRGVIVEPGDTFSVNEFIGPRTREKGFVSAGVIYNGVFREDVGGGISQYATTMFNAAFFAGLDFGDYQSHTIYISRYPFGREATLSFPRPDLEIINTTPFPVMLWPTTTDTSITVRLYSTPWVVGEQTGQTQRGEGAACTRVTTERTRTWLEDGRTETDTVTARYRPEGVACDGSPTITTTTTTTVPESTTTTSTTPPPTTSSPPTTTTTLAPTTSTTTTSTTTTTATTTTTTPTSTVP